MSEMIKTSGGFGTSWMTDVINNIVKECRIPEFPGACVQGESAVHTVTGAADYGIERVLVKKIRWQI